MNRASLCLHNVSNFVAYPEQTRDGFRWQTFAFLTEDGGQVEVRAHIGHDTKMLFEGQYLPVAERIYAPGNAGSWFQQFQQALLSDAPNDQLYTIAKSGEEERQQLLLSVSQLQEQLSDMTAVAVELQEELSHASVGKKAS